MTFQYVPGQRYKCRNGDSVVIAEVGPFDLSKVGYPLWANDYAARTAHGYYVTARGYTISTEDREHGPDLVELLVPNEKQASPTPGPIPPTAGEVKGLKFDGAKPGMGLVSPIAQLEEGMALTYGARKYAKHNYLQGLESSRVLGALLRHVLLLMAGEEVDPESGVSHIGHIRANTAMWRDCQAQGSLVDDRPYNEKYAAELLRVANEWSVLSDRWTADAKKKTTK